jgi:hypothetical protein
MTAPTPPRNTRGRQKPGSRAKSRVLELTQTLTPNLTPSATASATQGSQRLPAQIARS